MDCIDSKKKSQAVAEKLSSSLAGIYQNYDSMHDWPDVENKLQYLELANEYERLTHVIHTSIFGNANAVLRESMEKLESHVSKIGPEIKNQKKDRHNKLVGMIVMMMMMMMIVLMIVMMVTVAMKLVVIIIMIVM